MRALNVMMLMALTSCAINTHSDRAPTVDWNSEQFDKDKDACVRGTGQLGSTPYVKANGTEASDQWDACMKTRGWWWFQKKDTTGP